jgi:hypothetical protein
MSCQVHQQHGHVHNDHCGHTRIRHNGHVDYLHDGHLHAPHGDHYDEHTLAVDSTNPAQCTPIACACKHDDCGHEKVPHGDHVDFLVNGRLHHPHGDHCDDHGPVVTIV